MKKILNFGLIATLFVIASCATQVDKNPNYAANLEVAKSFMLAHASEDIAAQTEMLHDDLVWQPPFYGAEKYGKAEHIKGMLMYQTAFDNILFTADSWLTGVNAETGELDGSVRTYGIWSGTHTETGKSFSVNAYHTMEFTDGKISAGGDYFDVGGMFASLQDEESTDEESTDEESADEESTE